MDVAVPPGDEHDMADLTEEVLEVENLIHEVVEEDKNRELVGADKRDFRLEVYLFKRWASTPPSGPPYGTSGRTGSVQRIEECRRLHEAWSVQTPAAGG